MKELTLIERVWMTLNGTPKPSAMVARLVDGDCDVVRRALGKLRAGGYAAVTGDTHSAKWIVVPGKTYHAKGKGSNPRSRANIMRNRKPLPSLGWADVGLR